MYRHNNLHFYNKDVDINAFLGIILIRYGESEKSESQIFDSLWEHEKEMAGAG